MSGDQKDLQAEIVRMSGEIIKMSVDIIKMTGAIDPQQLEQALHETGTIERVDTIERVHTENLSVEDELKDIDQQIAELERRKADLKFTIKEVEPLNANLSDRTSVKRLLKNHERYIGHVVGIAGWIRTVRKSPNATFVVVYDGSIYQDFQLVVPTSGCPGDSALSDGSATTSSSVFAIGTITLPGSPKSKELIEMQVQEFRLLGASFIATGLDENKEVIGYPLAKKGHTTENLRRYGILHFRPRTYLISAVSRVRNSLAYATHLFFQGRGFQYVHTPIITASDCEGAGEMFQISTILKEKVEDVPVTDDGKVDYAKDFFGRPAYLTVSGQLNGEIYACAMGSIYTFGPTFRAENSNTKKHLAEFWMIEPEIAFANLQENMQVAEDYVKFTLNYVLEHNKEEMEFLENYEKIFLKEHIKETQDKIKSENAGIKNKKERKKIPTEDVLIGFRKTLLRERITAVATSEFGRVSYTDAVDILLNSGVNFETTPYWGLDLGTEHERWLAEEYFKKPVIVHDYPKEFKAFYMRLNEDERTVGAMDVLVPGIGELIGGSEREERLDVLERRLVESGLDPKTYKWYLDLRRYGSVTHSGFGLGFERLVMFTTGVDNIRESIPFPRWPGHADY